MRRLISFSFGLVLLTAACGSSSHNNAVVTTTSTQAALTKSDFVTRADAICTSYNTKIQDAGSNITDTTPQAEQVNVLLTKIIPIMRQEVSDLRRLQPPTADRPQVAAIFDAVSSGLDSAEHELKTDPAKALGTNFDPFTQANKLANDYGLTTCGSSSS